MTEHCFKGMPKQNISVNKTRVREHLKAPSMVYSAI